MNKETVEDYMNVQEHIIELTDRSQVLNAKKLIQAFSQRHKDENRTHYLFGMLAGVTEKLTTK
jgi:hypothetical protein|tara:strand:+ start:87 stop:275 length:189 start_codon:yes stop_codon:yes gene_type:complete